MINLLPYEEKRQLKAARTNTLLIRYNAFLVSAVVFLGLAIGITYFFLVNARASAEVVIGENKAKVADYAQVEAQAQLFRANLTTAKQILDSEVTYTKVMLDIARLMPNGTVLDKLSLDAQTFGTPTTMTAQASSYEAALRLKEAFQASAIFSDVNFQSITSSTSGSYPLSVSFNVTIKKDVAK
jgi:Tfp pilus assembly protein PilN